MSVRYNLFATAPKGLEPLLADELRGLDAQDVRETRAGVSFAGDLSLAYRACLWTRLANRILLPLTQFPAPTPEALYAGVQTIKWSEHLSSEGTLAVDANVSASAITHSRYAALKVKDAIVDQLRTESGVRPSVDTGQPDVRVNLYLARDQAHLSLDLSGESLHRRGYRLHGVEAPLKENLAAAILLRAGWPAIAARGGGLADLMCGSGTFLVEAATMVSDIAPGLGRLYFGFLHWRGHDAGLWERQLDEALARQTQGRARLDTVDIRGYDTDPHAIRAARANLKRAGLDGLVSVEALAVSDCRPAGSEPAGLVVANPPYGERLGSQPELPALYSSLGAALRRCYPGWRAAVFTGNPELGRMLNLRAHKLHTFYNGAIECKLLHIEVPGGDPEEGRAAGGTPAPPATDAHSVAGDFSNRLQKNYRHLSRWARREGIYAWRVYDADLHDYNFAIDIYECESPRAADPGGIRRFVHVQEYQAPATVDPRRSQARLARALAVIPGVLSVASDCVYYKQRRRQTGGGQYEKLGEGGAFHIVREGACRLSVNFTDYLDTGLFLDHRPTRVMLGEMAKGKHFLNLFAYTGAATVHAALGGALSTTTVDMSRTYLDWAGRNLALNAVPDRKHERVQADVLQWLEEERGRRFDLIFLDPPTFSRSKRMEETFDIQRDHVRLIQDTARLLAPEGVLIFSTNLRKFRLDKASLSGLEVRDITRSTLPRDFERNPKIHRCFRIVAGTGAGTGARSGTVRGDDHPASASAPVRGGG